MKTSGNRKILIVCGESSGEANAAQLINRLKTKDKRLKFYCIGGDRCRKEGAKVLFDISELGIVGFWAAIKKLGTVFRLRSLLVEFVKSEKPDLIIIVDFPDFNLWLLSKVKRFAIPAVYFIPPQVWVWRKGRLRKIKRLVKRVLVVLPFEEEIFRSVGIDAHYIGNPVVERVKKHDDRDGYLRSKGLNSKKPVITLLPGSRENEITDIFPEMLNALRLVREHVDVSCIIAPANTVDMNAVKSIIEQSGLQEEVVLAPGEAHEAVSVARVVIAKSGTSTVEVAMLGVPFIVVYKIRKLAFLLWRILSSQRQVALANIVADGDIIPELIQSKMTAENIFSHVLRLLNERSARSEQLRYLKLVQKRLGSPGAAERAAELVLEVLS